MIRRKIELKQRLETVFLPLINRASQYVKQLEAGEKTSEITAFLRKEMVELSPNLLHGKSLTERAQGKLKNKERINLSMIDLQGLIEQVEECNREEESFTNILKAAMDDPDQVDFILRAKVLNLIASVVVSLERKLKRLKASLNKIISILST